MAPGPGIGFSNTVKIADDFTPPDDTDEHDANGRPIPCPIDDTEARLAYVAVTRARARLDIGGLSWINDHPDASAVVSYAWPGSV